MLPVWLRALSLLCNGWPAAARRQEKGFPPAQVGGNEDEDRLISKKGVGGAAKVLLTINKHPSYDAENNQILEMLWLL